MLHSSRRVLSKWYCRLPNRTSNTSIPCTSMRSTFHYPRKFNAVSNYASHSRRPSLILGKCVLARRVDGARCFSWSNMNPIKNPSGLGSKIKTGMLVVTGFGVAIVATSAIAGILIGGAAMYGVYSLFDSFRRHANRASIMDMKSVYNKNSGHLSRAFGRNSLFLGMPLIVQGMMNIVSSVFRSSLQASASRVSCIKRATNDKLNNDSRIRNRLGYGVYIDAPTELSESCSNGRGNLKAIFPVLGSRIPYNTQVRVDAMFNEEKRSNHHFEYRVLEVYIPETREQIDLLLETRGTSPVVEAEFKEK